MSSTGIDVGPIAQNGNDGDQQASIQVESTPDPEFDRGMIGYLQMALTLIEGRKVIRDEVIELLTKSMRQRSFDREGRFQYILRNLTEKPP